MENLSEGCCCDCDCDRGETKALGLGCSLTIKKLNHGNNGHLSFPVTRLLKTTLVPIIFIRLGSEACDWA